MIAIEPITEPTVKPTIMETLTSGYTLKQAERKRIDALGKLNDRRLRALAEANKPALLELAAEYAAFGRHGGCPRMAQEIIAEAEAL